MDEIKDKPIFIAYVKPFFKTLASCFILPFAFFGILGGILIPHGITILIVFTGSFVFSLILAIQELINACEEDYIHVTFDKISGYDSYDPNNINEYEFLLKNVINISYEYEKGYYTLYLSAKNKADFIENRVIRGLKKGKEITEFVIKAEKDRKNPDNLQSVEKHVKKRVYIYLNTPTECEIEEWKRELKELKNKVKEAYAPYTQMIMSDLSGPNLSEMEKSPLLNGIVADAIAGPIVGGIAYAATEQKNQEIREYNKSVRAKQIEYEMNHKLITQVQNEIEEKYGTRIAELESKIKQEELTEGDLELIEELVEGITDIPNWNYQNFKNFEWDKVKDINLANIVINGACYRYDKIKKELIPY